MLTHTRSCPALTPGDDPCTCGLVFRIQLQKCRERAEETEQKTTQQAEELYKRAFDDGAMATQTHLKSLNVAHLEYENERLRIVNRDLKVQVQRWIDKASQLERSLAETKKLVNDYVEEIKKLNRSNMAQGWQPIETAPKDGTVVIGFDPTRDEDDGLPHGVDFMRWWNGCWIDPLTHSLQPTHWKLPDPPKEIKPQDPVLEKVKEPEPERVSKHSRCEAIWLLRFLRTLPDDEQDKISDYLKSRRTTS